MFNSSLTIAVPLYNESETIDYMKERLIEAIEKINLPNLNILFVVFFINFLCFHLYKFKN